MGNRLRLIFLLSLLWKTTLVIGQGAKIQTQDQSESLDSFSIKHNILPVVYYLPETSLGFGGLGILSLKKSSHHESTRPSQLIYSAAYTLKKQLLFYFPFEFYGNRNEKRLKGELGYYRYFYNYFGIGSESLSEQMETYKVNFPRFDINYAFKRNRKIYIGAGINLDLFDIQEIKEGGLLDTNKPPGHKGGTKANVYAFLLYDNRDNPFSSKSGRFAELKVQRSLPSFISDFDYFLFGIDLRNYSPVSRKLILASRFSFVHTTRGAPFFDMPNLSSQNNGRGFDDRRFINPTLVSLQNELRFPLYKRFSGVAFVGVHLIPDFPGVKLTSDFQYNLGAGGRFLLDPENRTVVRIDVGKGGESFNFYLTINEVF